MQQFSKFDFKKVVVGGVLSLQYKCVKKICFVVPRKHLMERCVIQVTHSAEMQRHILVDLCMCS